MNLNDTTGTGGQRGVMSCHTWQIPAREVWTVGRRASLHAHCTHRLQTCRSRGGLLTPTQGQRAPGGTEWAT